jgi:hypothetical protein
MYNNQFQNSCCNNQYDATNRSQNHLIFGILIILVGLMLLAKKMGVFFLHVHFMPVIFILLGLFSGIKHRFHNLWSWALITFGVLLMIPRFWVLGVLSTHLVGPIILILIGLFLLFKSHRSKNVSDWQNTTTVNDTVSDNSFYINASFGEQEKIITSQSFEGGTVEVNFSDATINLMNADIQQTAVINVKATCSEINLFLPDHWNVTMQAENNFSTLNDRRWQAVGYNDAQKNIIIKGKLNFSEIKLKSK